MVAKFHAVKPKPINDKAMSKTLLDATKKFSEYVIKGRDNVTTGWQGERPKWDIIRFWANQYQIGFQVGMAKGKGADKWTWLDLGTKPHEIRAKNGKTLAFPSIYHAGSRPGQIRTYRASSGGETVFTPSVHHPGTEARGWSKMLEKDEQIMYERWMKPAMADVARVSGHEMEK